MKITKKQILKIIKKAEAAGVSLTAEQAETIANYAVTEAAEAAYVNAAIANANAAWDKFAEASAAETEAELEASKAEATEAWDKHMAAKKNK